MVSKVLDCGNPEYKGTEAEKKKMVASITEKNSQFIWMENKNLQL